MAKFGLWENGKWIKWFDPSEARQVAGTTQYFEYFKTPASAEKCDPSSTFDPPTDFDQNLDKLESRLNTLLNTRM